MPHGIWEDITGRKYGIFTVLRRATEDEAKRGAGTKPLWLVRCDCGQERFVKGPILKSLRLKSCGIAGHIFDHKSASRKHGLTRTPEWFAWCRMKGRCYNPKSDHWQHYGGRGIKVCDRWINDFTAFFADMGPKPSAEHSIDRRDTNGDYTPENCCWATDDEQRKNQRRSVYVEVDGERVHLQDYAAKIGIKAGVIYGRLKMGWSLDEAVTVPVKKYRKT